jgi:hypothetical protein
MQSSHTHVVPLTLYASATRPGDESGDDNTFAYSR